MKAQSRQAPRMDMCCRGRVVLGDGSAGRDCIVIDITRNRARLVVDQAERMPVSFRLVLPEENGLSNQKSSSFQCELLWRYGNVIGVMFASVMPLTVSQISAR